jgi:hypothetical protein
MREAYCSYGIAAEKPARTTIFPSPPLPGGISVRQREVFNPRAVKTPARILSYLVAFACANLAAGMFTFPRYRDRACSDAAAWVGAIVSSRGEGPSAVSSYWQLGYIELTAVTTHGKHYAAMVDRNHLLVLATPLNLVVEPDLELRQFW